MSKDFKIRLVTIDDAEALLAIYTPFVISEERSISDVSFEYEAPSLEEFANRIQNISAEYPYLVCEYKGNLLGYAYAHPYIPRAAYQWGAEVTIYLAPAGQGKGIGRVLYAALEELLKMQGIINTYACVTASNLHSVKMHEALGYRIVGSFKQCGFKHGHWLDMVWLEKVLCERPQQPPLIKKYPELEDTLVEKVLAKASMEVATLNLA